MPSASPVTIGLPIYNAERYLAEAINSIKAQTFADFDVLAVLDGCTDRSEEILESLKDERFVVIRNERNLGLVKNLNIMLERTSALLFARMDADDIMLPERIGKQVEFMNAHPDIDVLGTYFDQINEQSQKVKEALAFPYKHEDILERFRLYPIVHHPTVMFRTVKIRSIGGYDDKYEYAEDLALWLRCFSLGYRFALLPETLLHYRMHRQQLMTRKLELTCEMADRAYATFGPAIWGERAPDFVAGINRWHRRWRMLKRWIARHRGLAPAHFAIP
jgi:glycosyltransferase involved in cell wall biosynthesis